MTSVIDHGSQWGRREVAIIYPDVWNPIQHRSGGLSIPRNCCAFSTASGGGSGDMGALQAPGVVAAGVPGVPGQSHGTKVGGFTWFHLQRWALKHDWLVVWTPLKNISQLGWLFPIHGKIKMFQTTNQMRSVGVEESNWVLRCYEPSLQVDQVVWTLIMIIDVLALKHGESWSHHGNLGLQQQNWDARRISWGSEVFDLANPKEPWQGSSCIHMLWFLITINLFLK